MLSLGVVENVIVVSLRIYSVLFMAVNIEIKCL